ncbi:hypothetical protein AAG747_10800 [Rapidithrix thailandica]|uniref:Uncharacterized protein n=1 Tax=Rapidithrix thailandica TaxID=413964 RepID=A0AAW9RUG5_9BACT
MRTNMFLSVLFGMLMTASLTGCIYIDEADVNPQPGAAILEIYVYRLGNDEPVSGRPVQVYWTKEDARNQVNAISSRTYTRSDGTATIYNLPYGHRLWVRVDQVLIFDTERTSRLHEGINYLNIGIF